MPTVDFDRPNSHERAFPVCRVSREFHDLKPSILQVYLRQRHSTWCGTININKPGATWRSSSTERRSTSTKVHPESTVLRPYQIPARITVGSCSWGIYTLFGRTDFQRGGGDTTDSADASMPSRSPQYVWMRVSHQERGQDYRGQIAAGDSTS